MATIKITSKPPYIEEGQPNPMRWLILSRNEDGTYQNESAWLKCKDFFNDLVYTIQTGKSFLIYNFTAGQMNPAKKGQPVYMLLDVLTPTLVHNLTTINNWLVKSQKMPALTYEMQADNTLLVVFDPVYFKNTYNISLISLIIRLCNYPSIVFNTFTDLETCDKFPKGDQCKWDTAVEKQVYFKLPKALQKYVWYSGESHNSNVIIKNSYQLPQLVHNNGVVAWSKHL